MKHRTRTKNDISEFGGVRRSALSQSLSRLLSRDVAQSGTGRSQKNSRDYMG